jgi:hypothetical protein
MDNSVNLALKGKPRKTFDVILYTKPLFLKLSIWGGECKPAAPPPSGARLHMHYVYLEIYVTRT